MEPRSPRSRRALALLPAAAALLTYANTLPNGFVADDHYNVERNPTIRRLADIPSHFARPWASHATGKLDREINQNYWRPLSSTTFALEHALHGGRPWAYHLSNALLHALCVGLLALLLLGLVDSPSGALLGALFFAVHPVHSETVNLLTYRTELLATAACLGALLVHASSSLRRGTRTALVCLLYACGLAAKESAVTLPAWLFLFDLVRVGRGGAHLRELARTYLPLAALLAGYLALRAHLLQAQALPFFGDLGPGLRFLSVMKIYLLYVRLLLVPWPLLPFYDWTVLPPAASIADGEAWAGFAALLGTVALIVGLHRSRPLVALGLGAWLVGLLPFAHLVPLPVGAAERFLYLPACGIAIVVAELAARLGRRLTHPTRLVVLAAPALALLAALTFVRSGHFRSDERLTARATQDFPESFNARFNLGQLYLRSGRTEQAIRELLVAERLLPGVPANVELLGRGLLALGRASEAHALIDRTCGRAPCPLPLAELRRVAAERLRAPR